MIRQLPYQPVDRLQGAPLPILHPFLQQFVESTLPSFLQDSLGNASRQMFWTCKACYAATHSDPSAFVLDECCSIHSCISLRKLSCISSCMLSCKLSCKLSCIPSCMLSCKLSCKLSWGLGSSSHLMWTCKAFPKFVDFHPTETVLDTCCSESVVFSCCHAVCPTVGKHCRLAFQSLNLHPKLEPSSAKLFSAPRGDAPMNVLASKQKPYASILCTKWVDRMPHCSWAWDGRTRWHALTPNSYSTACNDLSGILQDGKRRPGCDDGVWKPGWNHGDRHVLQSGSLTGTSSPFLHSALPDITETLQA